MGMNTSDGINEPSFTAATSLVAPTTWARRNPLKAEEARSSVADRSAQPLKHFEEGSWMGMHRARPSSGSPS